MAPSAPIEEQRHDQDAGSIWRRLAWFVLLWLVSVGVIGLVAFVLRLWIG